MDEARLSITARIKTVTSSTVETLTTVAGCHCQLVPNAAYIMSADGRDITGITHTDT